MVVRHVQQTPRGALVDESIVRALRNRVLAGLVGYGLGLVCPFFAPQVSLAFYAAMPGRIDRHRRSAAT